MKTKTLLLFLLFIGIATTSAIAQEWTKEQKEVWQVCVNTWENYKVGKIDAIAAVLHPKYNGWDDQTPLPYTKEKSVQQIKEFLSSMSLNYYDIEPARIIVTESAAVIDYYYSYSFTITQGDKKEIKERKGMYVEFYVKEKGTWLLLGDMTTRQQ